MSISPAKIKGIRYFIFLKDVMRLALTAIGGPGAHFVRFEQLLVTKKRYLSRENLLELNSLCQLLPGPTSTQTLTAIGFRLGGPLLAIFTLIAWILPATFLMTGLVFIMSGESTIKIPTSLVKYLPEMALGFIIYAAFKMLPMLVKTGLHIFICCGAALLCILISYPAIYPLVLLAGGTFTVLFPKPEPSLQPPVNIKWRNLLLLGVIFLAAAFGGLLTQNKNVILFENVFRFGSLVFGGGNVLIPMMYDQFVIFKEYMNNEQFMTGVGLVQAIPGPVFSFSTYATGMVFHNGSMMQQLGGCVIGTVAIFMPGMLLIFFVYPIWNRIKIYRNILKAIEGVNAASAGLMLSAAWLLCRPVSFSFENVVVIAATIALLWWNKLPSPVIVLLTLLAGYFG